MKKTILLSVAIIASIAAASAQKLAPAKGQKLEMTTASKMNMEVMGQAMTNESATTTTVEVKEVTSEGYLFSNSIKRLTMKAGGMGQDINFDSDKKEDLDTEIGQALKTKIGVAQDIQVDKQGKISDVKGLDPLIDSKGGFSDMMNMTNQFSKGAPYSLLIQLPKKAVKQGDSWTDSSGSAPTIKTITTYTFKSINADGITVAFAGTVASNGTVQQNGMEFKMDMTGNTNGESLFDTNTGILKSSTTNLDMKGTLGMMGNSVPISSTMSSTVVAKKM